MAGGGVFYIQPCPTCGWRQRVCVQYLGRDIECRHCHAVFTARDPENIPVTCTAPRTEPERLRELPAPPERPRLPSR